MSTLSLCPWRVACKYGSISRFKGVFGGFCGVCVGLYCSGTLRGLWGFCVREWLGGFGACGVFAFLFISLPAFCPSPCLLCSGCLLLVLLSCLFLWSLSLFPFPLRYIRKKGRNFLRPLFVCCVLVYMFSASLSVVSFVFENIHPAPQERWLLNLPPRFFRVSLIALVSPTTAIAFSE